MDLGPLKSVSNKAFRALDRIAKILENVPADEWSFVLSQAKKKAEENNLVKVFNDAAKKHESKVIPVVVRFL